MTIVNFAVTPERVLVGVDTLAGNMRGTQRGEISKLHTITHRHMLVTGRGLVGLIAFAARKVARMSDVDEVEHLLAPMLTRWLRLWMILAWPMLLFSHTRSFLLKQEVYVFGYSVKHKGMVALSFEHWPGETRGFECSLEPAGIESISPGGPEYPAAWNARTMLKVAREQVRTATELHIGGRLILAELTRLSLTVHTVGTI